MQGSRKTSILFIVWLFLAIGLYLLVARYAVQWDITHNRNNSLSDTSVNLLQRLDGRIDLTVFRTGKHDDDDTRTLIRDFVALYRHHKPDITLAFVDPALHPEQAQQAGVQADGEMLVEYGGRREHLTRLSEQALSSALLRLARSDNRLLMYLDGHGERKLDGIANRDLGEFGKRLQQNGYQISSLNLSLAQDVPANASMLVLTQPQVDVLRGEVDKLQRYLDHGGNLLWLVDAEPLHGLQPLADKLGLPLAPGIVIDPAAEEMRAPANWALASSYPLHAVTHNFNLVTVFPYSRSLQCGSDPEWHCSPLVLAAPRGWVSRNSNASTAKFDKSLDIPGPATIALALERNLGNRQQRIIVVGSGAFLANPYSGNGGNIELGLNMVNWLSDDEKFILPRQRAADDSRITLSKTQLSFLTIGLVIALPLLLILVGGVIGWRRRK